MKQAVRLLSSWVAVCLLSSGVGLAQPPVPISPGDDDGEAIVISGCPTFSWSEAAEADLYRVEVFEADGMKPPLAHVEMAQAKEPLLEKTIPERGFAWTPSANACLCAGTYVWYVAALHGEDIDEWSEGSIFRVDALNGSLNGAAKCMAIISGAAPEGVQEQNPEGLNTGSALSLEQIISTTTDVGQPPTTFKKSSHPVEELKQPVIFQGSEGISNTFYGEGAGHSIDGDRSATFIGVEAGYGNTTGDGNTFLGKHAGRANETGYGNTFVGAHAGHFNTTGFDNTFFGKPCGYKNLTGSKNVFIGSGAGYANTTGSFNVFVGNGAGANSDTSGRNTFIGAYAGYDNIGSENIFLGTWAGYENSTGYSNAFVGMSTGKNNTTGYNNSFFGATSGRDNTTGASNTFLGSLAGQKNTTGSFNTFLGMGAGSSSTAGERNVFIGFQAGSLETGSDKLYIDSSVTETPLIYGEFDKNILKINGQLQMTSSAASSDIRLKREIEPLTASLDKVLELQGVTYLWRSEQYPGWGFAESRQIGLVAQDVEAVIPELVSTDSSGFKAVSYDKLTAVLVEAVKELRAAKADVTALEELKAENAELRAANQQFELQLDELRAMIQDIRG